MKKTIFFTFLLAFFLFHKPANAAVLYFEGPKTASLNQEFTITAKIDTENQSINVIEGVIKIPEELEITKLSEGGSILTFWQTKPAYSPSLKTINFTGGLIYPGFNGPQGQILSFKAKLVSKKSATISYNSPTQVLLNDGEGTNAKTVLNNLTINFLSGSPPPTPELADTTPPDIFEMDLGKTPEIYNNQYFLAFQAKDEQSGIDHYEIAEFPIEKLDPKNIYPKNEDWQIATSPYLLKNQNQKTILFLKAVDGAGNKAIRSLIFEPYSIAYYIPWVIIIILILLLLITITLKYWNLKRKKYQKA